MPWMRRTGGRSAAAAASGVASESGIAIAAHFKIGRTKGSFHIGEGRFELGEEGITLALALHDCKQELAAARQELPVEVRAADDPDFAGAVDLGVEQGEVAH